LIYDYLGSEKSKNKIRHLKEDQWTY
jgi:hypothetical protein